MAGSLFRLETVDGTPAEPPTLRAAVPNWSIGDTIPRPARSPALIGSLAVRYFAPAIAPPVSAKKKASVAITFA
jgi:hypothetical protein